MKFNKSATLLSAATLVLATSVVVNAAPANIFQGIEQDVGQDVNKAQGDVNHVDNNFDKGVDSDVHKVDKDVDKGVDGDMHKADNDFKSGMAAMMKGIPSTMPVKGTATWYGQESRGSCGNWYKNDDFVVAMSHELPYNKFCGKKMRVTYKGKSLIATVADTCEGCKPPHIDMSRGAFSNLADGNYDLGVLPVDWHFIDPKDEEEYQKQKHANKNNDDN